MSWILNTKVGWVAAGMLFLLTLCPIPMKAAGTCVLGSDTPCAPPIHSSASNVLFIPGTLTSRLYMKNPDGSERELWEPRSDLDIEPLTMNPDGSSVNEIYTRDIIDRLYSNDPIYGVPVLAELKDDANAYGPFEKFMDGLVSDGTITEWEAFPYDWRYDVSDIVKDGTLIGTATSSPTRIYLQDAVSKLASTSPTGKVTIIAHSNGGLIAKALAADLQSKNHINLIDKIIMVGTPQLGTPKSITDLLHGDEFTELGGLLMYSDTVRNTEKTMPGPYDLLPSPAYFSNIPTPVATFDSQKPADLYQKAIGTSITIFSQLSDFVTDTFNLDKDAGLQGSPKTPIALSPTLVAKAGAMHETLDAWVPPAGVQIFAIVGWGQLTPYGTNYTGIDGLTCDRTDFFVPISCSLLPQIKPVDAFTENGDDTVIAKSAQGLISDPLFFNSKNYFSDTKTTIVHKDLLSAIPIQNKLKELLVGSTSTSSYFSSEMPTSTESTFTIISAHSPANLLATDAYGNETGIVPIASLPNMYFEKSEIPGSSVHVLDDEKYLYLPSGVPYTLAMQGYDIGTTTIDVEILGSDESRTLVSEFKDIPTTASTSIIFKIGADGKASSDQFEESTTPEQNTSENTESVRGVAGTKRASHASAPISIPESSNIFLHFTENVSLHGFTRQEAVAAFITLETGLNSTTMLSTVFLTILPFLH